MKVTPFALFVALLMVGCGESIPEIEDKPSSLVADVDEVVEWVMDNYSSIEDGFAGAENDLRSSDAPAIKILDDLAKLVSDRRIQSEDKKKKLIALKEQLEGKKLQVEKVMKDSGTSVREGYQDTLLVIAGELDEKLNPLLDFDFQYLEKFDNDLNASMVEWKQFVEINDGVKDEAKIRSNLATMIAKHFEENMEKPIEQRREKWGKGVAAVLLPDLGLEMLWVKPGSFTMGSPISEADRYDDERQHQVTLGKGFYLGKHEVTQAQWERVMGNNPSQFNAPARPVEKVSWDDAVAFCKKLTETERSAGRLPDGMAYQLPTEAQWEYACRAGTESAFSCGESLTSGQASISGGPQETKEVGSYLANAWGFHDMHGNVWEWCVDWYGDYPLGSSPDPVGPAGGGNRVGRGGSWFNAASSARCASRGSIEPGSTNGTLGFRLSLRSVSQ